MIDRVLIVDDRYEALCEPLQRSFPEVTFDVARTAATSLAACARADALVAIGPFVTAEMLAAATRLRWIQSLTAGMESLLALVGSRTDLTVTSARGVAAAPVAEFALLSMMALARAYPTLIERQRDGRWERSRGNCLAGRTVVIVGVGAIGEALATRCAAFEMRVVGVSASRREAPGFERIVARGELSLALGEADFVVLCVPLADDTRRLVDARMLASMAPTAFLVNVARGDIVDTDALLAALRAGTIAGAALDVVAGEPLPPDHPLWKQPNVIVTPHVAGDVLQLHERALPLIEHNLRALRAGHLDRLVNVVRATAPDRV